ncbi:MAG: hypothetical protein AB9819_00155 [Methanomassiliicoccales archaeon]
MEVLGLCSICSRPARYSCTMCGRLVCPSHYDKHGRLCDQCSPERRDDHMHRDGPERHLLH